MPIALTRPISASLEQCQLTHLTRVTIDTALARLTAAGVDSRRLTVSHAFHSPLVQPMLDEFERVAAGITYAAPRLRLISNVTGQPIDRAELTAAYWRQHVREPVRFADSIATLQQLGYSIFVEIGRIASADPRYYQVAADWTPA